MSYTPNVYAQGALIRCSGTFQDTEGAYMDPTKVFFSCKTPEGVVAVFEYGVDEEVVKDSVGHYHSDLGALTPGAWTYRFYSTGTGQAADERYFIATRTEVAP